MLQFLVDVSLIQDHEAKMTSRVKTANVVTNRLSWVHHVSPVISAARQTQALRAIYGLGVALRILLTDLIKIYSQ